MASLTPTLTATSLSPRDSSHDHHHDPNHQPEAEKMAPSEKAKAESGDFTENGSREEKEWEYLTGAKLFVVLAATTLCAFIMLLDTAIVVTAIPVITSQFHSLDDVGWYGSAYLLACASLQPMTGKLYKWTFLCFLALFEVGSTICGAAQSSDMLIIGRAIAGLGGAGIMNGCLTIISAAVPLHKRALHMGIMMSFAQLGILSGPVLGGALTEHASWRWCFYINLPIGAVVGVILLIIQIPDRTATSAVRGSFTEVLHSLDLPGFAIFAPTSVMFLLALEWGGSGNYAWGSPTIIGLFVGSFVLLLVFLAWEYKRGDSAMIPLKMLSNRIVWTSCLFIFFFFGALMAMSYYLAIYFQAVRGYTPTLSGVYVLPSILPQMALAVIGGVGVSKFGYYLPWAIASGVIASIGTGLLSSLKPDSSTAEWVGYQVLLGIGRGAGFQMAIVAVQNALPESQSPIALAIVVFFQTFAGALFLSFCQATFSLGLGDALAKYAPSVAPLTVITAGASNFRYVVDESVLDGVIFSYNQAVQHVFYLATGASVGMFLVSFGMGWKDIRKDKGKKVVEGVVEV